MKDNKAVTIIGYILIGILLLPIIAVGLYVGLGAILFYILLIIDRVKNGKSDVKEGRTYKTVSGILITIATILAFVIFKPELNIFNLKTYFIIQGIIFIGLIPLCIYKTIKIRRHY